MMALPPNGNGSVRFPMKAVLSAAISPAASSANPCLTRPPCCAARVAAPLMLRMPVIAPIARIRSMVGGVMSIAVICVIREGYVHALMCQVGGIPPRALRRSVIGQQRHPLVRVTMPPALVVARQEDESKAGPPVRKFAPHPPGLDVESNIAIRGLRQQEPLDTTFDVSFEGVIAEPKHHALVTYHADDGGTQVAQTPHLDLEQHRPLLQWRGGIEVCRDNRRV